MTNYFEFFDLPPSWSVDLAELKRRYYANSRAYHPDRHRLADEATQSAALEKSSLNNDGYQILIDEDKRLRHLLEVSGVLAAEGDNQVPQEFLMEVMALNEALMELEFEPEPEARERLNRQIATLESRLTAEVADLRKSESEHPTPYSEEELERLRDYYLKRRYLHRLHDKI